MNNDPRLKNEYSAWLIIFGFDFSPDELTKQLGIEPSEIRIKGETRIVGKIKHKLINRENAWILKSELFSNVPLEKHLEHLMKKIEPYKQNFVDISQNYSIQLNSSVYYYEVNPNISLKSYLLKEISELNIPLHFDIYCLSATVKQFDDPLIEIGLTKELSKTSFVSELNEETHNEAVDLVKSLQGIEIASHRLIYNSIPQLNEDNLTEDDYKSRIKKIGEDLQEIIKYILRSKLLSKYINKRSENDNS